MPHRVFLVVPFHLGQDHLRCDYGAFRVVYEVVVALLVAHFQLGHVRAGGIEPLLITGNLGDGQVGLVEPRGGGRWG